MKSRASGEPRARLRCIVIAGPNGAGKTTFAREFLPKDVGVMHFVNADLIASGLSPLRPESAAIAAGKLFLAELDRMARSRMSFAFESTLSGLAYASRLKKWKSAGYRVEIVYLKISSPQLALRPQRATRGCVEAVRTELDQLCGNLSTDGGSLVRVR